jgi:hypothetical protein
VHLGSQKRDPGTPTLKRRILADTYQMSQFDSSTETIRDGGFRIEIQPDELAITADKSAWKIRKRTASSHVLSVLFLLAIVAVVIVDLLPDLLSDGPVVLAVIALIFTPAILIAYLSGCKNLRCNRQSLQVVRVARGRLASTTEYPRESIQKIRFAAVSYSEYRAIFGLVFEVNGKKVKVLSGLESPEALRILSELRRLRFDTIQDVGMPMAAEMVIERRNSWLGH